MLIECLLILVAPKFESDLGTNDSKRVGKSKTYTNISYATLCQSKVHVHRECCVLSYTTVYVRYFDVCKDQSLVSLFDLGLLKNITSYTLPSQSCLQIPKPASFKAVSQLPKPDPPRFCLPACMYIFIANTTRTLFVNDKVH